MIVTLGEAIRASKSNDILGIDDRGTIIDYISRAIEIAAFKANWDPWVGTMDLCCDNRGYVTLPDVVDTVLATNIGGAPALFRNAWYEFHVNGVGSNQCGSACGLFWDDKMWSPVLQDLQDWSLVAAICEDPIDGNGSLELIVEGETMDSGYNQKMALTIPVTGPSTPGVRVKLLTGVAATDPGVTYFKKITRITKPVTRGYVKLLGFPPEQLVNAVTLGYFAPNETKPLYKRMRVSAQCSWVRVRFRRKYLIPTEDYEVLPISSKQALIWLLKSIRLSDTNNPDTAQKYEDKGVNLLNEIQTISDGPGWAPLQFDPAWGVGTIDVR